MEAAYGAPREPGGKPLLVQGRWEREWRRAQRLHPSGQYAFPKRGIGRRLVRLTQSLIAGIKSGDNPSKALLLMLDLTLQRDPHIKKAKKVGEMKRGTRILTGREKRGVLDGEDTFTKRKQTYQVAETLKTKHLPRKTSQAAALETMPREGLPTFTSLLITEEDIAAVACRLKAAQSRLDSIAYSSTPQF
uniref:Uncharacterized protein n=1 Tax=Chromera velia CCMP2878 TaxID=1169474 RepID=A0A0G4HUC4_9ALVE|eukprot:Cvel_8624.t1-p1 / transcript=Cvel_8624.t1 / gene=Cvel_8624 / organism=Chromera_velia_CCMP2878 / gene_product=hypothetical protein / transcript_product=hypothetical protein / location=Cvel_scaffold480:42908-43678(-) / protein_length=189 / sequence_SO=supercontig / SO=protein_coding / is_pseudo=false